MEECVDYCNLDEEDYESEIKLADYLVVPRPQELIQLQTKTSSKSKGQKEKSVLRESLLKKEPKKSKEKSSKRASEKSKDAKKSTSKSKSGLSGISKVFDKTAMSRELSKKFESHLLEAKKSLSRLRYNKSDASKPSNEDSEKHGYRSSSPAVEHSNQEQNFLKAMKEPSFSAQERYDALNAQDSYIRLKEAKKCEPKSKIIKGTCPDMCPEKERYSRIAKNLLAVFELEKGLDKKSNSKEVNHCYMIKEYSRSSADQQEPLPHELRPVPALMFTMDYLICNIIDRIDDSTSVADWYDFVWNRTRSIRKDITQQQLCDVESVDILEKCARFHIFCAEALAEEDTATFDPKINNENLTKCLQTLKHMYHDLQTKGVHCPNEAEFRAYDILLSLTEGETLRLVKDFRKEVFKSPLVKSAFEAALAFNSNNYVKFFKLMENATYLSSCIMHRYIHEARVLAVQVIIRAYSLQNNSTTLPLSSLVKDLKFATVDDAANFCRWHGLSVDGTNVTIQRQTFQNPVDAYPVARVASLVQIKMKTGLGMIVNNGPLSENPLNWYEPENSFNEEGLLQDKILTISEPPDSTDLKQVEDSGNDSMDFEITPALLSTERFVAPPQQTVMKTSDSAESELSDFKVKTFENFISKSQKQKTESFSFFSDDTLKSNIFKPELQNEKSSFVDAPKSTSSKESIVPKESLFSSAKIFKTPEVLPPSTRMEDAPMAKCQTFKAPQTLSKTFSFKSPIISLEKSPFVKTGFGNKSMSFFSRTSKETNNGEKTHSAHNSFIQSSYTLEGSATIASKLEVYHTDSSIEPMDSQQDVHKTSDFQDQDSEIDIIYSYKSTIPPSVQVNETSNFDGEKEPVLFVDDAIDEIFEEESESDQDSSDDDNSHMSMENDETLKRLRDEKIHELILNVEDEVYSQCIKELSSGICEKMIDEEWEIKNDFDACVQKMRLNLAQKALYKWKLFCERKKQRTIYNNSEPLSPWLPMLMNTEYVTSGATSPFTVYKKHCSLTRLADSKLKEREAKPGWEPLETSHFESLNDQPPLPSAYLQTTGIVRYFKLGLVFATYPDDVISYFMEWMCKKFKLPVLPDAKINEKIVSSSYTLNGGKTVVSIRTVVLGSENISDCDGFMNGMSAMVLCCPARFPNFMPFKAFLDKFSTLLKEANLLSAFPLFTFVLETNQKCNVLNQLASFLDERLNPGGCFSAIKMNRLPVHSGYVSKSSELVKSVKWLIGNQEPRPLLLSATLQNFLEDSYASAFNALFWKISLQEFKPLVMLPEHIITFYNKMLDSRADLLFSEYLMAVSDSWPPRELLILQPGFRSVDKLFQKKAADLIKMLHLPEFKGDPSSLDDVWRYVRKIGGLSGNNAMLFINVQTILQSNTYVDWPTIISKCAYHIICSNLSNHMNDMKDNVYYMKEDLDSIDFEDFWQSLLVSLKQQHLESKKRKVFESIVKSLRKKRKEIEQDDMCFALKKTPDFGNVSVISSIPDATTCHVDDMLSSLKSALKKQNEESDKFLLKLNESVSDAFAENDQQEQTFDKDLSSDELLVKSKKKHNMESLLSESIKPTTGILTSEGTNTWDKFVGKKTSVTVSTSASLSEKLAELRYNIQKNNILEDNLSLLLDL